MPEDLAAAAIKRFRAERPRFERAGQAVVQLLEGVLAPIGIAPALSFRVKEVASFRTKVALKGYSDPWAEVTDKVGVRAMVHRPSEVDAIHRAIAADGRLEIWDVTDKRQGKDWDEFGYSGLHLDLHAPPEEGDAERVLCELQIRTVAQHAWSVVSHKLLYKPEVELPSEDKHAIMRLVALVELFDEEVERVMERVPDAKTAVVSEAPWDLADIVTAQYHTFAHTLGYEDLTRIVLPVVAAALERDGVDDYQAVLNAFVDQSRPALEQLYADYGPESDMATSPDYLLWSQPESLALLESLERRPNVLLAAWHDAGLPDSWLRPLAAHTDATLFDV